MAAHGESPRRSQDLETWCAFADGRLSHLTPMERACLELVAQRRSSKEIAKQLGIAKSSVDTYCDRARSKLAVADRYAAARLLAAESAGAVAAPFGPDLPVTSFRAGGLQSISLFAFGVLLLVSALSTMLSALQVLEAMKVRP